MPGPPEAQRDPITVLDAGSEPSVDVLLRILASVEQGCWFDRRYAAGVSLLVAEPDRVLASEADLGTILGARGGAQPPGPYGFAGGWAGWISFEENVRGLGLPVPRRPPGPWLALGHYPACLAVDHRRHRAWAVGRGDAGRDAAAAWLRRLTRARGQVRAATAADAPPVTAPLALLDPGPAPQAHGRQVRQIQCWIAAGETYVANLTYRLALSPLADPATAYGVLSRRHPAPYAVLARAGGAWILSASPELLLRRRGTCAATRPIKGTRALAGGHWRDLRDDPKERAELAMVVDLERNDLGRLATTGSVHVPELFALERHPGLAHLVATVVAEVPASAGSLLRAMLPGGSVTGAPKQRTVELLTLLEGAARGVYTGSVGYCDDGGDMEWNVAIRTLECLPDRSLYGTGGGITADSDPVREYQETRLKARGVLGALGVSLP